MNYWVTDLRTEFTLNDAAYHCARDLFADDPDRAATILNELITAARKGELATREGEFPMWSDAIVQRDALAKWFDGRGLHPAFLFPEFRGPCRRVRWTRRGYGRHGGGGHR